MANVSLLNKLMGRSAHFEMIVRRIYRNPLFNQLLKNRKPSRSAPPASSLDFTKVIDHLRDRGIKPGDILIVHSAYRPLKSSGLSPAEIVSQLLDLVGPGGTLAMPVIRKYPESPPEEEALTADISQITFKYDVANSKVWTGAIPKALMQRPDSITSRFPLNTLTAEGPAATEMMKNNLAGDLPAPNGINSPWKYCTDHNAWVVSIGIDLTHSLTMIHTAEDVLKDKWPVANWYRKKKFIITDGDFKTEKTVLERHPKWGMLHFGERKLAADLIQQGVINSQQVAGLTVETLRSQDLYRFLNARNAQGYPYFWVGRNW